MSRAPVRPAPPEMPQGLDLPGVIRVLLVEDSENDAQLILRVLRKEGFAPEITRVDEETPFRRALENSPWDVVLADYSLPRFSGIRALEALNELKKDIPLLIISGTITEETAVAAMRAGARDYIMKNNLARLGPALRRELAEVGDRRKRMVAEVEAEKEGRARRLGDALNAINVTLGGTLEPGEILRRVLQQARSRLGSDWAVILLADYKGGRPRWSDGLSPTAPSIDFRTLPPLGVLAASSSEVVVIEDAAVHPAPDRTEVATLATAFLAGRLISRGTNVGSIVFGYERPRFFSEEEIDFVRKLAVSASLSLENARLYQDQASIARVLQDSLSTPPFAVPGLRSGQVYRSATEAAHVGGDFFDVYPLPNGLALILIGDVSGKGIEAATLASVTRETIRAYALQYRSPGRILELTNHALLCRPGSDQMVSVAFAILNPRTGEMRYSLAGHPPPVLVSQKGAHVACWKACPPLGMLPDLRFFTGRFRLDRETILVFYTDGITEARVSGDLFGERRLIELLLSLGLEPPESLPDALLAGLEALTRGRFRDDAAVLAVGLGPSPRELGRSEEQPSAGATTPAHTL